MVDRFGAFERQAGPVGDPPDRAGQPAEAVAVREAGPWDESGPPTGPGGGRGPGPAPQLPRPSRPSQSPQSPQSTQSNQSPRSAASARWRLRNWRLRSKLALLLVLPLALVVVLAGLRVQSGVAEANELAALAERIGFSQQVQATVQALQHERAAAAGFAGSDRTEYGQELEGLSGETNAEIERLRTAAARLDAGDAVATSLRAANARLDGLTALRGSVTGSAYPADDITAAYTSVVAALRDLDTILLSGAGGDLQGEATAVGSLADAKEQISRQHATLLAVLAGSGRPSQRQIAVLRDADAEYASALIGFTNAASPQSQQLYASTVTGVVVDDRERIKETAVVLGASGEPVGVPAPDWDTAAGGNTDLIRQVEQGAVTSLAGATNDQAAAARADALRAALIVGVLVLAAVILLLIVVRSLLRPLRVLRIGAFDVASRRLPAAIQALRSSDDQPSEVAIEPIGVDTREELGEVARAFDAVHREALRLAAEQALLRTNINDIFVNLSRRSQALVKRQLGLIDKLESDEQDPEHLSNLFQLDHLATRMRRNNENLLVLAGAAELRPRRRRPVPVDDVLRAAVSEIEQYQRVTVRRAPAVSVAGPVVNDLVHLIAELLDNATSFSPPESTVVLASSLDQRGALVIDIIDSGVGIDDANLHVINAELADPPTVDVAVSRRMGLFVVGRLSQRNDISVRLQPVGPGQGLRALVTVPPMVLMRPDGSGSSSTGTTELQAPEPARIGSGPAQAGFERSGPIPSGRPAPAGPGRPGPGWPGSDQAPPPLPQPRSPQRSGGWEAPGQPVVPAPRREADSRPVGRTEHAGPPPAFPGQPVPPSGPPADAPSFGRDGGPPPSHRGDPLTDLFESVSGDAAPEGPEVPIYDEVRTSWFRLQMRGGEQPDPQPGDRPAPADGNGNGANGNAANANGVNGVHGAGGANGAGYGNGPRPMANGSSARPVPDRPAVDDTARTWEAPRQDAPRPDARQDAPRDDARPDVPGQQGNDLPVRRPGATTAGIPRRTEEPTARVPGAPVDRTPAPAFEPAGAAGAQSEQGAPAVSEWGPIDNGWLAAREFAEFTKEHLTENGLPKRAPRARLIPGAAATGTVTDPRARNPEAVRGRLSEYQRGLLQGRYTQAEGGEDGEGDGLDDGADRGQG